MARNLGVGYYDNLRVYLGFSRHDSTTAIGSTTGGDVITRFYWSGQAGWKHEAREQFHKAKQKRTKAKLGTIQFLNLILGLPLAN